MSLNEQETASPQPTVSEQQTKWDYRFLRLAKEIASWSKDPSTQCGAVVVRPDKTIASLGYNGFPKGMPDRPEDYADREVKYSRVIHAEMNALLNAKEQLLGYTLYVWPFFPCDRCAVHIIQSGIKRVVCPPLPPGKEHWGESFKKSVIYFREAEVETHMYLGDI